MVYAGIMAHGTSLTAVECARMIPQLSATSIRPAMRWARDERRLSQACQAVLEFMPRHPIAATWGRADLASSEIMNMETTTQRWHARCYVRHHLILNRRLQPPDPQGKFMHSSQNTTKSSVRGKE